MGGCRAPALPAPAALGRRSHAASHEALRDDCDVPANHQLDERDRPPDNDPQAAVPIVNDILHASQVMNNPSRSIHSHSPSPLHSRSRMSRIEVILSRVSSSTARSKAFSRTSTSHRDPSERRMSDLRRDIMAWYWLMSLASRVGSGFRARGGFLDPILLTSSLHELPRYADSQG